MGIPGQDHRHPRNEIFPWQGRAALQMTLQGAKQCVGLPNEEE
eukprot:CAMPEP_0183557638 /NCGR_PEP_ID=MMETSP0371-20130417/86083_1 /TAXON_ID=268820 /ORGANISM="Peridinium aciculiferum, Strain PAER-2" /LENGTH=42 /DNA_ID= /DNA_START= /DNA_END= /DNA_ORIENTATION=